jgi:hypothetical protein
MLDRRLSDSAVGVRGGLRRQAGSTNISSGPSPGAIPMLDRRLSDSAVGVRGGLRRQSDSPSYPKMTRPQYLVAGALTSPRRLRSSV